MSNSTMRTEGQKIVARHWDGGDIENFPWLMAMAKEFDVALKRATDKAYWLSVSIITRKRLKPPKGYKMKPVGKGAFTWVKIKW